jgi:sarcosine oxidase gamma subunit
MAGKRSSSVKRLSTVLKPSLSSSDITAGLSSGVKQQAERRILQHPSPGFRVKQRLRAPCAAALAAIPSKKIAVTSPASSFNNSSLQLFAPSAWTARPQLCETG